MLKKEAAQARLSLFVPKCHIVENFMSRLKCLLVCVEALCPFVMLEHPTLYWSS